MKIHMWLLMAALLLSGCHIGVVSDYNINDWPVREFSGSKPKVEQIGGGEHAALIKTKRGVSDITQILSGDQIQDLVSKHSLEDSLVRPGFLYRRDGSEIWRQALNDQSLGDGQKLASIDELRDFDIHQQRALYSNPYMVFVQRLDAAQSLEQPRALWFGHSLAIHLDRHRDCVWVASDEPIPVIDCLDRESGEVLLRCPLPLDLESANLKFVQAGPRVAIYAHDRAIESALIIDPDKPSATSMQQVRNPGSRSKTRRQMHTDPKVVWPHGQQVGERILIQKQSPTRGRLIGRKNGQFVVIDNRATDSGPSLSVVTVMNTEIPLKSPKHWPRSVHAVAVSDNDVVFLSSNKCMTLRGLRLESAEPFSVGRVSREGVNVFVYSLLVTGEVAVGVPTNAALGCLLAPIGLGYFCATGHPEGLVGLLMPVTLPFLTFSTDFPLFP